MSQEELLELVEQGVTTEVAPSGGDAPATVPQAAVELQRATNEVAPDGDADEEEDNDDDDDDDDGWESPKDPFPTEPRRRPTEDELDADYAPEEQGPPRSQRRRR
ncbi:unnamed protein product [Urochloa humidicola]